MTDGRFKTLFRPGFIPVLMAAIAAMALVTASGTAHAVKPVYSSFLGGAIRGYDPVAYFTEGKPVKGKGEFQHKWMGATWSFASAKNRDLFQKNPDKYAPQYGGYCAWAVSQGYTASITPDAWKIVDNRLYLNYSLGVQKKWAKDIPGHIARANANWPKILKGK